jgi:sec-independent protein translocase protein TatA
MPFGVGPAEVVVLLVVALLVFGPKRLPEMGRSLGRGLREFRDSVAGRDSRLDAVEEPAPADDPLLEDPAASARHEGAPR